MILDHCHRASCAQIIEALRAKVEELSKERDLALSYGDRMGGQLVLAQARIKVLREALDRLGHHEICHESCEVCKLLAITNDSSALEARLAQERERCAKVASVVRDHRFDMLAKSACELCANAIRELK